MHTGIRIATERAMVSGFFRVSEDYTGICSMLQKISLELDYGILAARFEEDTEFGEVVAKAVRYLFLFYFHNHNYSC